MHNLYVVRHGLRANFDTPPTGIPGDVSISKEGFVQAEELAVYFKNLKPPLQRIYSSPFYRCLQTIAPTAVALGLPIRVERGVSEYYHTNRPTHPVPRTASENYSDFPMIDIAYSSVYEIAPGGESRQMLLDRVRQTMAMLASQCEDVDSVVVATHAATKIAIAEALVGQEVRTGTASIDHYTYESATQHWTLLRGGYVGHLSGGEQMHWDFSMHVEAGSIADEAARAGAADPHAVEAALSAQLAAVPAEAQDKATARVLLPLDFQGLLNNPQLSADDIEIVGLESDNPVVRVNDKVFSGQWHNMVGTELFTTHQGDLLGQSRQRVVMQPVATEPLADTRPLAELLREEQKPASPSPPQEDNE